MHVSDVCLSMGGPGSMEPGACGGFSKSELKNNRCWTCGRPRESHREFWVDPNVPLSKAESKL